MKQSNQLGFMSVVKRDRGRSPDGQPLTCTHYQIEWRVNLNNRVAIKDMEQDLALPPSTYWEQLREKADDVLRRKVARNRRVKSDDTKLVVSVNDRSQCDLTKCFEVDPNPTGNAITPPLDGYGTRSEHD
jgi:hypothetical protein